MDTRGQSPRAASQEPPGCLRTSAPEHSPRQYEDGPSEFVQFLNNNVPIAFVTEQVRRFLRREGDKRLQLAQRDHVQLADLVIGEDCLPTWPGREQWDPERETLHAAIQGSLIDYDVARNLGDLVRGELMGKGNMKLEQARLQGIRLHDLFIGSNLLPAWNSAQDDDDDGAGLDGDDESDTVASQTDGGSLLNASFPLSRPRPESSRSSRSSDSSAGDESIILLNNFVSPEPIYEEDDESNIFPDAQVVGSNEFFDLEVFLLDDDDDVADLPEVELSIDREAFENHYDTSEAVDVEISGTTGLFCSQDFHHHHHHHHNSSSPEHARLLVQPRPLFEMDETSDENTYDETDDISEEDEDDDENVI